MPLHFILSREVTPWKSGSGRWRHRLRAEDAPPGESVAGEVPTVGDYTDGWIASGPDHEIVIVSRYNCVSRKRILNRRYPRGDQGLGRRMDRTGRPIARFAKRRTINDAEAE